MLRYALDTNFCIRVLRDRPQSLRERFNENANALCISDVVLYELLYGAEKSQDPVKHRRQVELFGCCHVKFSVLSDGHEYPSSKLQTASFSA
ncbi:PIN domain-containing protein (plasmid) [Swingsia samuiensis]|uniref:PIN domain-containing protein n=1 Tax=Swingsia samuiensis TaxID=1293412 RepID=A0A4Y6UKI1_9PROT|nr:PIN domain-containing protein [Swingsia samuiensis]